ncbi:hypothetical protein OIDMADRAFT_53216 [Oidiodendron maius Zn]|uniref:Secreted protein n=1 Tax=Oidiodendron maius (strain Zn) TaxID=913774 RepID=A0A0C3H0I1_OIDMZ|nr:hypothetical protein OIDMADRAFT_53216 [Oidiodendron maius Zn]
MEPLACFSIFHFRLLVAVSETQSHDGGAVSPTQAESKGSCRKSWSRVHWRGEVCGDRRRGYSVWDEGMHRIQLWPPIKMVGDDTNPRPRQIRKLFLTNHFSQYATAPAALRRYDGPSSSEI